MRDVSTEYNHLTANSRDLLQFTTQAGISIE